MWLIQHRYTKKLRAGNGRWHYTEHVKHAMRFSKRTEAKAACGPDEITVYHPLRYKTKHAYKLPLTMRYAGAEA